MTSPIAEAICKKWFHRLIDLRKKMRFIQIEKKTMHRVRLGVILRENEFVTVVIYENLYSNLLIEVTI